MGTAPPPLAAPLATALLLLLSAAALGEQDYVPNRLLVVPKRGVMNVQSDASLGMRLRRTVGKAGVKVYEITDAQPLDKKIAQLKRSGWVELVEPDYRVSIAETEPDDSDYSKQWHLPMISAPKAWDVLKSIPQVKVCVLDTGVDSWHPDLQPNLIKVLNVYGVLEPDEDGTDWNGHGTHTSGTIAAVGNNGLGVSGVAWNVGLVVCRFLDSKGAGSTSDAIRCMELCRQEGAHITSNSYATSSRSQALEREIEAEGGVPLLVVAAAGNSQANADKNPEYPAAIRLDNVVSVGASTEIDTFAGGYSNYGMVNVDIIAPGSNIYSTTRYSSYGKLTGTSMATPIVAGAAALLQATAMAVGITLTPAQLKQHLLKGVDVRDAYVKKAACGGRLNVSRSIESVMSSIVQQFDIRQSTLARAGNQSCAGWARNSRAAYASAAQQVTGLSDIKLRCARSGANRVRIVIRARTGVVSLAAARALSAKLNAAVVDGSYGALVMGTAGVTNRPLKSKGFCVVGFPECPLP